MMKETQEAVHFIVMFANAAQEVVVDVQNGGPHIFKDITAFIPAVMALPSALKNVGNVPDEIRNATEADKEAMIATVQKELKVPFGSAKLYVDQALEVLLQFWLLSASMSKVAVC